jgi:parallel beta-helix repeat protein
MKKARLRIKQSGEFMLKRTAILFVFVLFLTSLSFGATYYVDNVYGNNANNGLSTSSAWKTISKVNGINFSPGDQILFKRGGIWYETLTVKTSGTSSSPIVYGAYGSGNNPIIDGSYSRNNAIYVYSKSNIVIRDLKLQRAIGSGQIRIAYGNNIRVENNQIYITGHGGVFIENSSNCVILRNSMTTPSGNYDKQTDGIYSQRNSNNFYDSNSIVLSNDNLPHHIDGIQSYIDNNLTVRNNYIYQNNTKPNGQGIYATTGQGIHNYYNNIVYAPNSISSIVGFRNLSAGTGSLRLYHNTLIGKGGSILYVTEDRNLIAKNNIFISAGYGYAMLKINTVNSSANINNNLYYNGGGTNAAVYNGVAKTFSQWKSMGFEANGVMGNPMLEPNYTLKPGSAAINRGVYLSSTYNYDRGGRLRPQMGAADIGAYESRYSGKEGEIGEVLPEKFELSQNFPNPFNPTTQIRFSLPEASEVTLKIYDILGKEVTTLVNETRDAGTHEIQFDATQFASGVYVYQIKTANFVQTKKMSLLK